MTISLGWVLIKEKEKIVHLLTVLETQDMISAQ